MHTISPSALACQASGIDIDTESLELIQHDTHCVTCGIELRAGAHAQRWVPKASFTDYPSLANPSGSHTCPSCAVTLNERDFTQTWLQTIFTQDGVFQTASSDMRAHALLSPPMPPFVWVIGDQKIQHVVWRTPVTWDHEAIVIRFGERLLRIRSSYLRRLSDAIKTAMLEWADIKAKYTADGPRKKTGAPKLSIHPFTSLDREYSAARHGALQPAFLKHLEDPAAQHGRVAADLIQRATAGEIWALSAVLLAKSPTPPRRVADPSGYRFTKVEST